LACKMGYLGRQNGYGFRGVVFSAMVRVVHAEYL
jgi:hypothetical protein